MVFGSDTRISRRKVAPALSCFPLSGYFLLCCIPSVYSRCLNKQIWALLCIILTEQFDICWYAYTLYCQPCLFLYIKLSYVNCNFYLDSAYSWCWVCFIFLLGVLGVLHLYRFAAQRLQGVGWCGLWHWSLGLLPESCMWFALANKALWLRLDFPSSGQNFN